MYLYHVPSLINFVVVSIIIFIVNGIICGFLTMDIAARKGKSDNGFLIGFFFGIFGLLWAASLPDYELRNILRGYKFAVESENKLNKIECPGCHKLIGKDYTSCPKCGFRFEE